MNDAGRFAFQRTDSLRNATTSYWNLLVFARRDLLSSEEDMKRKIFSSVAAILIASAFIAMAGQVRFAIVYGPEAAFNIAAPAGWVIDNSAGAADGLPCVLYRKGDSWEGGDPLMYAKVAGTSVEDAEAFVKKAIEEMNKTRGEVKTNRVASGKTKDGRAWFINEYAPNEKYARFERVAYIQLPKAVAYIVFTAGDKEAYKKHQPALEQVVASFGYLEPKKK